MVRFQGFAFPPTSNSFSYRGKLLDEEEFSKACLESTSSVALKACEEEDLETVQYFVESQNLSQAVLDFLKLFLDDDE